MRWRNCWSVGRYPTGRGNRQSTAFRIAASASDQANEHCEAARSENYIGPVRSNDIATGTPRGASMARIHRPGLPSSIHDEQSRTSGACGNGRMSRQPTPEICSASEASYGSHQTSLAATTDELQPKLGQRAAETQHPMVAAACGSRAGNRGRLAGRSAWILSGSGQPFLSVLTGPDSLELRCTSSKATSRPDHCSMASITSVCCSIVSSGGIRKCKCIGAGRLGLRKATGRIAQSVEALL